MVTTQIDPKLLDILRCPVAVHYTDKGEDPGTLEIVGEGYWLYSEDSGYKYPVINGIPKMLIEEGEKWKDTEIDALPVPPPNDPTYDVAEEALSPEMQELATKLADSAAATRNDVVSKLRETAANINSEARETSSDTLKRRSEDLARGLEDAADLLEGKNKTLPMPQAPARPPYVLIAVMFVFGILAGIWMRGSKN